jgi:hypothetical protein
MSSIYIALKIAIKNTIEKQVYILLHLIYTLIGYKPCIKALYYLSYKKQ